jgi:hypothetical protein
MPSNGSLFIGLLLAVIVTITLLRAGRKFIDFLRPGREFPLERLRARRQI